MKNTRRAWGVGAFDNGQAYYQACLKFHLSTNATAREVRDIGIKEVARIKALMVQVCCTFSFLFLLYLFINELALAVL